VSEIHVHAIFIISTIKQPQRLGYCGMHSITYVVDHRRPRHLLEEEGAVDAHVVMEILRLVADLHRDALASFHHLEHLHLLPEELHCLRHPLLLLAFLLQHSWWRWRQYY